VSARIINGKAFAERLSGRIVSAISTFQSETGRVPGLAFVLVGNDPASEVYVRSKDRKALELGMESFQDILPENTTQEQLLELVAELNANDAVDGILVQLPLPNRSTSLRLSQRWTPARMSTGYTSSALVASWQAFPA
jgi:methylenetetrahydrofolate dehydrogenase (NADP+)/methenyltetrahydrofolate cyclohydrolase